MDDSVLTISNGRIQWTEFIGGKYNAIKPRAASYRFRTRSEGTDIQTTEDVLDERLRNLNILLKIGQDVSTQQHEDMRKLCSTFVNVFHLPGDRLTHTNVTTFRLPLLPEAKIINIAQYRLPEAHKQEVHKQVTKMLEDGIIEESISPYNSPMILVPKKAEEGSTEKNYRLCIDYRKLNLAAKPYQFPLPRIDEIIDKLGNAKYFSTLDLSQGFHQVLIDEPDREKTAFSTTFGHYQYRRCPFGLKTLPGFFQSLLNNVMTGLQGSKCFVYIDDVVVFGTTVSEHNEKLTEVLKRLQTSNLKLNPKKCSFLQQEIKYLGHKCSSRGVEPDEKLTEKITKFPQPRNVKEMQSFHGLANYYRKFIPGFAKIATPLYQLTNKDQPFIWTEECTEAFTALKKALTTSPVLAYPDFEKLFDITTDASSRAVGAILEQEGRVIFYASKTLTQVQSRWSATELELYGVMFGCQTFRHYVLGRHFRVYTDHLPLKGEIKLMNASSRIVRLQQHLSEYDFEVVYKKGKLNTNADCLSRTIWPEEQPDLMIATCDTPGEIETQLLTEADNETIARVMPTTRAQARLHKTQQSHTQMDKNGTDGHVSADEEDPVLSEDDGEDHEEPPEESINELSSESGSENEGPDNEDDGRQRIVRKEDKKELLRAYHDMPLGGHFGSSKTYAKLRQKYTWRGMKADVGRYIQQCAKCQLNKGSRPTRMPLQFTQISKEPFDKVYVDVVGPLPISGNGNKYILSMVDDLTRFVEFAAMPDQQSETVARVLFEHILCRYNIPKQIVTDNGTNFVGQVFNKLCKLLGVKKLRTTAYHPQANMVERQHSTLGNYIRTFTGRHPTTWDMFIRPAAHAYNNTPHVGMKVSPMAMLYGFVSEIPTNLKKPAQPTFEPADYCDDLRYRLRVMHTMAREHQLKQKLTAKTYHDKRTNATSLEEGDLVLLIKQCRNSKLDEKFEGPYQVVELHGDTNATILRNGKKVRMHRNLMKKFHRTNGEQNK